MKAAYIIVIVILIAVAGGVSVALIAQSAEQPIPFNHKLHIEEAGMECTDCHLYAVDGVRATIPNLDICGECHAEPLTESAHEARVAEYVREGVPIPWRKVYWVPEHVYFSHRRHTAVAEIACETCHGIVGERSDPLTRPLVRLDMDACMKCHKETGASNDCVACHM